MADGSSPTSVCHAIEVQENVARGDDLAADEEKTVRDALVQRLRDAFAQHDWAETLAAYADLAPMFKGQRIVRLEATCLAARAQVALGDRSAARALLKPIAQHTYNKVIHYDLLARAFLDLRNYKEVARVCQLADQASAARRASETP